VRALDLMARPAETVGPADTLARAASIMRNRGCGAIVVVSPDGRAIAMVTDRDICMAVLQASRAPAEVQVGQAMSRRLFTCSPDDDVARIEGVMSLHQVRRLPVVDSHGRPLGVVSLDDLAKAARGQRDLFAPAIRTAGVGRVLGDIGRPRLVTDEASDDGVTAPGGAP
jgi:CBS domain-containing protein